MPYADPEVRRTKGNEYAKRWRERNHEKHLAAVRRWREAHPEQRREYESRRVRDPAKRAATNKAWRNSEAGRLWLEQNRERLNALRRVSRKAYCKRNPERIKGWKKKEYERHRDEIRAKEAARRAANREHYRVLERLRYLRDRDKRISASITARAKRAGARGSHTVAEWKAVLRHYKRRCAYCGTKLTTKNVSRDHFIPLSKGGDNSVRNLVPACRPCNSRKHAKVLKTKVLIAGWYT